eukprot:scaffold36620_cov32-Prasinocladus_malaysianus.AAC.2
MASQASFTQIQARNLQMKGIWGLTAYLEGPSGGHVDGVVSLALVSRERYALVSAGLEVHEGVGVPRPEGHRGCCDLGVVGVLLKQKLYDLPKGIEACLSKLRQTWPALDTWLDLKSSSYCSVRMGRALP